MLRRIPRKMAKHVTVTPGRARTVLQLLGCAGTPGGKQALRLKGFQPLAATISTTSKAIAICRCSTNQIVNPNSLLASFAAAGRESVCAM
jgi:hypothetical protein